MSDCWPDVLAATHYCIVVPQMRVSIMVMRLFQLQMALLILDNCLQLWMYQAKALFPQNRTSFIRHKWRHLMICLHMIQLNSESSELGAEVSPLPEDQNPESECHGFESHARRIFFPWNHEKVKQGTGRQFASSKEPGLWWLLEQVWIACLLGDSLSVGHVNRESWDSPSLTYHARAVAKKDKLLKEANSF